MTYRWVNGVSFYFARPGATCDDVWWRAVDKRYANYDPWAEFEQPNTSTLHIELQPYRVMKYTPKGVILEGGRFVLGTAAKQFAVPTVELALADLVQRKRRHVAGCEARLRRAKQHLEAAEKAAKIVTTETQEAMA